MSLVCLFAVSFKQAVPVSCCVSNSSDADTVVPLDSKRCEADAKSRKKPSDFYYSDVRRHKHFYEHTTL